MAEPTVITPAVRRALARELDRRADEHEHVASHGPLLDRSRAAAIAADYRDLAAQWRTQAIRDEQTVRR